MIIGKPYQRIAIRDGDYLGSSISILSHMAHFLLAMDTWDSKKEESELEEFHSTEYQREPFENVSIDSLMNCDTLSEPETNVEESVDGEKRMVLLAKLQQLFESELSDQQQKALCSLLHGMSVEVFAEKTGSNRNAVYDLIHDARVKLKVGFEAAGHQTKELAMAFA